jgi:hypothetical protein
MRTIAAIAAALLLAGAAASAGISTRPALRLLSRSPIAVQGLHFKGHERVAVTATFGAVRSQRKMATATLAGGFHLTFGPMPVGPCESLTIHAVGSRGSVAALKLPQPACIPA